MLRHIESFKCDEFAALTVLQMHLIPLQLIFIEVNRDMYSYFFFNFNLFDVFIQCMLA